VLRCVRFLASAKAFQYIRKFVKQDAYKGVRILVAQSNKDWQIVKPKVPA